MVAWLNGLHSGIVAVELGAGPLWLTFYQGYRLRYCLRFPEHGYAHCRTYHQRSQCRN